MNVLGLTSLWTYWGVHMVHTPTKEKTLLNGLMTGLPKPPCFDVARLSLQHVTGAFLTRRSYFILKANRTSSIALHELRREVSARVKSPCGIQSRERHGTGTDHPVCGNWVTT